MTACKTIGILGGMGPAATVEFFRRLVEATPATIDQNHLHILIDNDPSVPDRTLALLRDGPSPEPALAAMARRLASAGAEVLAMPCNTAHAFLDAIRAAVDVTVVDMIAETADRVGSGTVGLLATSGTIESGVYRRVLDARGIRLVVPDGDAQRTVGRAIEAIKAGRDLAEVEHAVLPVAESLRNLGAEVIVAGCTEISLLDGGRMPIRWVDALDCLVEATIDAASMDVRCKEDE